MNTKTKGYLLGAVAAASYGMNPLFALPLYRAGMNTDDVLFFRYLLAIPILGIMVWLRGRSFRVEAKAIPLLAVMGLLVAMSSLTLFLSYHYMDAGIASTLLFVYPMMVALIMVFFFHERLTLNTIFCLCLALIGIGLLYKGEDGATLNTTGMLMVLISALLYAIYIAGVNRPPLNNIPTISMTFYVLVAGLFLFVAKTRFCTSLSLPEHLWEWGNLLALAVLPTTVSFLCTTQAVQYIGATPTAILGVLEPVTALFIGVLVFDEAFTVRTAGGVVLIILAVALVIAGGNFTHQLVRFRHLFPRLKRRKKNSHRECV